MSRRKATSDIFRCWPTRKSHRARAPRRRGRSRSNICRAMRALSTAWSSSRPLADVVIEQRQHEQLGRVELAEQPARSARAPAPRSVEPLEIADGQQRVLVDRVLVVEVAHDAAGDRLELGEHLAEQPGVVHLRQPRVETRPRLQEAQQRLAVRRRREEIAPAVNRPACCWMHASASSDTRAAGVDRRLEERQPGLRTLGRLAAIDEADAVGRAHEVAARPASARRCSAQRSDRSMARAWRK